MGQLTKIHFLDQFSRLLFYFFNVVLDVLVLVDPFDAYHFDFLGENFAGLVIVV